MAAENPPTVLALRPNLHMQRKSQIPHVININNAPATRGASRNFVEFSENLASAKTLLVTYLIHLWVLAARSEYTRLTQYLK